MYTHTDSEAEGWTDGVGCSVGASGAAGSKASWRVMGRKGETKREGEGKRSKPPHSSVFSVCRRTRVGGDVVAANTASHKKISSRCSRRRCAVPSSMLRND